jgi:hypothetical protein
MQAEKYLSMVTSAHVTKARYMAWLKVLFDTIAAYGSLAAGFPGSFSVDSAVGEELDWVGSMVGVSRVLEYSSELVPTGRLSDEEFRGFIKAKVLMNSWDGRNESLPILWQIAYPNINLKYIDNQDMTMTVYLDGNISDIMSEMIQMGMLVPIPTGVDVEYVITSSEIPAYQMTVGTGLFEQAQIGISKQV